MPFFVDGCLQLFVARHGESEGNRRGIVQGRSDWPLSERGRREASDLGRHLAGLGGLDEIYSSPLLRAWTTAETIATFFEGRRPRKWRSLQEIELGRLTGRHLETVLDEEPELRKAMGEGRSFSCWDERAESYEQAHRRARRVIRRMIGLHPEGGRILLVSHAGFILHLTKVLLGIPANRRVFFPRKNASLSHFRLVGPVVHLQNLAGVGHVEEGNAWASPSRALSPEGKKGPR